MRSVKPILWSRPTSDGLHQIKIRITENRKSKYVDIGVKIHQSDWNENKNRVKTNHPDSVEINQLIDTFLSRYYSKEEVYKKETISGNGTLRLLFEMRIRDFESQSRMAAVRRCNTLLGHLTILKFDIVPVRELTMSHRQRLDSYFITELKIESSTRHTYHKVLKTSLRYASGLPKYFGGSKEDIYYNHSVSYRTKTKISLNDDEIQKMFEATSYTGLTEKERFATLLFLFSFSTMGMRFKDVLLLRWKNFEDGDLRYEMSKNKLDKLVELDAHIANILKYFLPPELYVNPVIDFDHKEPKFKNHLSAKIYSLEYKFYELKMKQTQVFLMSSITSKKIKLPEESPEVEKILMEKDSYLIQLIIEYSQKNNDYVFTKKFEGDLDYKQIYNRAGSFNAVVNLDLKSVSKRLSIREFSFHSARHTFAYISRKLQHDIYLISKCLGHSSVAITEKYLRTFDDREVFVVNKDIVKLVGGRYKQPPFLLQPTNS
jgi:integrase